MASHIENLERAPAGFSALPRPGPTVRMECRASGGNTFTFPLLPGYRWKAYIIEPTSDLTSAANILASLKFVVGGKALFDITGEALVLYTIMYHPGYLDEGCLAVHFPSITVARPNRQVEIVATLRDGTGLNTDNVNMCLWAIRDTNRYNGQPAVSHNPTQMAFSDIRVFQHRLIEERMSFVLSRYTPMLIIGFYPRNGFPEFRPILECVEVQVCGSRSVRRLDPDTTNLYRMQLDDNVHALELGGSLTPDILRRAISQDWHDTPGPALITVRCIMPLEIGPEIVCRIWAVIPVVVERTGVGSRSTYTPVQLDSL